MARAIWRGVISFGMVSIDVRLVTATESKDIRFRQLHEETRIPVKQLRWSPELDREVNYDELVKVYEYAKDQYVIVDNGGFDTLPVPSKHTIDLTAFVSNEEIDPIHYERSYYLELDEAGQKPFALLLRKPAELSLRMEALEQPPAAAFAVETRQPAAVVSLPPPAETDTTEAATTASAPAAAATPEPEPVIAVSCEALR
jgi:Ku protein